MLRKVVLPLVIVSFVGTATISGCKVSQIDTGSHSRQIDLGSRQDHSMGDDGIENGVTITHGELRIRNVWARPSFTGANSAVYLNLQNHGVYKMFEQYSVRFHGAWIRRDLFCARRRTVQEPAVDLANL